MKEGSFGDIIRQARSFDEYDIRHSTISRMIYLGIHLNINEKSKKRHVLLIG
jgi:hypothetical protein